MAVVEWGRYQGEKIKKGILLSVPPRAIAFGMFSMPYDSPMWRPTNHPPRGHTSTLCVQYRTEKRKKQAAMRAFFEAVLPFLKKKHLPAAFKHIGSG